MRGAREAGVARPTLLLRGPQDLPSLPQCRSLTEAALPRGHKLVGLPPAHSLTRSLRSQVFGLFHHFCIFYLFIFLAPALLTAVPATLILLICCFPQATWQRPLAAFATDFVFKEKQI